MFKERRKILRRNINREAEIQGEVGTPPRSCIITDISDAGARLYSETVTPQKFTLWLSGEGGGVRRECRVVWRLGGELGVEFTDRASRSIRERTA